MIYRIAPVISNKSKPIKKEKNDSKSKDLLKVPNNTQI